MVFKEKKLIMIFKTKKIELYNCHDLGGIFNTDNSISLEPNVGTYRKVIPNKTAKWSSIIYRYACTEPFINS